MFKIWFDSTPPPSCLPLLEGVVTLGPSPTLEGIAEAEAFICPGNVRYDGARMDLAPRLRVIARLGVGYDNIDVAAASARHIPVVYAPDAPTVSTAEHAWALILAVAKKVVTVDQTLRAAGWEAWFQTKVQGLELSGRTLGLVGLGRIGSRVARLGRAFEMRVLAFDPYTTEEHAHSLDVALLPSLEALLSEADVVSLHAPDTPETRRMMNADRFAQMKQGAIFVNVARGALVDEEALVSALRQGRLAGAGLDVFAEEPIPPTHPLLAFDNVVVSPHIASYTTAGHHRIWETTLRQALQVLRGERPSHLLNPEIWETRRR
jgi:D-3-phosphoglycerate dehydrogenase